MNGVLEELFRKKKTKKFGLFYQVWHMPGPSVQYMTSQSPLPKLCSATCSGAGPANHISQTSVLVVHRHRRLTAKSSRACAMEQSSL